MMERKLQSELLAKVEDKCLLHKIKKEIGIHYDYQKGRKLVFHHDDEVILELAADTLAFWATDNTRLKDGVVCLIEDKRVVWKFDGIHAKKVLHLFGDQLKSSNLGNVEIKENSQIKKNVSSLEIFCSYSDYKEVTPKIDIICKSVEALEEKRVKIKRSDAGYRARVRKFVENQLDNDENVFCIYNERDSVLEIFAKSEDAIAKVEKEFKQDSTKMTERGKKNISDSTVKTTTFTMNLNETKEPRATVIENSNTNKVDSVKTESLSQQQSSNKEPELDAHLIKSIRRADAERSMNSESQADSYSQMHQSASGQAADLKNNVNKRIKSISFSADSTEKFLAQPEKGFSTTNNASDTVLQKHHSADVNQGSGSRFRYEFSLSGMKVLVYGESIVNIKGVDAIVNAANEHMAHGGGVAYYISKAAGKQMDDEGRAYVAKNGKVKVGDNCVTGAGNLPFKGIVHAVGPQWADYAGVEDRCAKDLYFTVINTLKTARERKWHSIALCAISAGIYGVPKELCAEMYVKALVDFSQGSVGSLSEVHFVDINLEILGLIKDAHERWGRSPNSLQFENAFRYPSASGRIPSNRNSVLQTTHQRDKNESGLLKFVGESKTKFDGSPVYEYTIGGALRIKIYTGNIIRLDNMDAIVCSLNDKFSGGLAKVVAKEGRYSYQAELQDAMRRMKKAFDGDVFVTRGGFLRTPNVLHVMIVQPITTVNGETMSRLKLINQIVFENANASKFRRFAIPLIGAGALQNPTDIAACCQQFAEGLIEYCKINSSKLRIEELHFVNQDKSRSRQMHCTLKNFESKKSTIKAGANTQFESDISTIKMGASTTYQTRSSTAVSERYNSSEKRASETFSSQVEKSFNREDPPKTMTALNNSDIRCTYFSACKMNAAWILTCGHMFCKNCVVPFKTTGKCYKCRKVPAVNNEAPDPEKRIEEDTEANCPICLCALTSPKTLPCGHQLCRTCLDQVKKRKPCCPVCNQAFGVITGTQPSGKMTFREIKETLPGYESYNAFEVFYEFPDGTQGPEHPKPGRPYKGTQRRAFLPNNREGKEVLMLLQVAFDRKLTFTIGESRTTGKEDRVTWNDIHHKTKTYGGAQNFAYPDPGYLSRVKEELAAKGVTEEDLKL